MPELAVLDPYEDLARGALAEITPAATVGAFASRVDEGDGVVSILFDSAMPGYPDWKWTVSVAQVDGEEPTVLEAELMPADGALLAPDWVPWSERLAEYKAAQETGESEAEADDDENDSGDDDSEADDDELDEDDVLGNDVLHGGDLDGVDIDDHDSDDDDSDDDDDEEDDDDDDDEDFDADDEQEKSY